MANSQLVTYIKQQFQLGESEATIKSNLRSVGWSDEDVSEAFKSSNPAASPSVSSPRMERSLSPSSFQRPATSEPKKIDLGNFSAGTAPSISRATASPATVSFSSQKPVENSFVPQSVSPNMSFASNVQEVNKKSSWVSIVLMGLVVVALAAVSGLLYKSNSTLKAQVVQLTTQNNALTGKIGDSSTDSANLTQRVAILEEGIEDLDSQLALFLPLKMITVSVVSTSSPTSTPTTISSPEPLTLKGTLSGGDKVNYTLTTSKNISVNIKNSKDAKVISALRPFVGGSVELTGTPTSGAREISVTHVNGAPIQ